MCIIQGVMNIYRFPAASSELLTAGGSVAATSDDVATSSLSSGLFRGLPSNEPVHVLVRIYVVKVRLYAVSAPVNCSVYQRTCSHCIAPFSYYTAR